MKDEKLQNYYTGVDIGSWATKAVLIDGAGNILSHNVMYSGADFGESALESFKACLESAGISEESIERAVSTGYGRKNATWATRSVTEISCHAKGCLHYFSGPITVVDIGGQDNKVIKLDSNGRRLSFKMNRKCAAGTGAFLEEMALRLRRPLDELDGLARSAQEEVVLGSYCTVFSATEVLEKIKAGHKVESIVKGLFRSVIKRLSEMDTLEGTIVLTGGVVEHNPFIAHMLREHVDGEVKAPPNPQIMGALGAALYALEDDGAPG
jgi:predicted CoA-substrate-specific enzyme activase